MALERTWREREGIRRHSVTFRRVPAESASDRKTSASRNRAYATGADLGPLVLSGLGENGYCSKAVKRIGKDYRGFNADMVGRQVTASDVS